MKGTPVNFERLAKGLAVVHHHGQRRVNGEEYIEHVIRVARSFSPGSIERQIAYLHDTVEDTSMTEELLHEYHFGTEVVNAVHYLTRTPGVTYTNYILTLIQFGSLPALRVKLADLTDNAFDLPESLASQAGRYAKAREMVLGEIWRRGKLEEAIA